MADIYFDKSLREHSARFIIIIGVQRLLHFVTFSFLLSSRGTRYSLILTQYACSLSDIDECREVHVDKIKQCHPSASCINTQGSYNCSCNPDYIGDGFSCEGTFGIYHLISYVPYLSDSV